MSEPAEIFTAVFLAAVAVNFAVQWWLATRHLKHVESHRERVPESFGGRIGLDEHRKAADYTMTKTRTGKLELIIHTVLLLLWTLGGGLDWLQAVWVETGWPALATGVGFIVSAFVLFAALDLPMSVYTTFVIEQRFGFNKTTVGTFISDLLKQAVLLILIGVPLVGVVLWLMAESGPYWWLHVWLFWMGFSLLLIWLYPVVIAPMFNEFSPLEDEALRHRIGVLLERNGLNMKGIFVMDGSKRSGHGNAYFTGFGANKRIVFFDTLLEGLDANEVEAVLAHEIGHFRARHIAKQIVLRAALTLAGLALLGWLAAQDWFYTGLGLSQMTLAGALLLFLLVVPLFTFFLSPLLAALSRKHEFEADAFAAAEADADTLVRALVKLYKENASTLTPDPLYSAFHDSHPPAAVRVAHLNKLATSS